MDELFALNMKCGEINLAVMEMLDAVHTGTYGHPVPTSVRVTPVKGKAILVSGHDLKDLEKLLKQTQGLGINVYTHGEMLPAHGYPELKKYRHLVGNYGGALAGPGERIRRLPRRHPDDHQLYTEAAGQAIRDASLRRARRWPGSPHTENGDFTPVIEAALAAPGFRRTDPRRPSLSALATTRSSASRTR